jgi:hypothetical protein
MFWRYQVTIEDIPDSLNQFAQVLNTFSLEHRNEIIQNYLKGKTQQKNVIEGKLENIGKIHQQLLEKQMDLVKWMRDTWKE